jgi:hypothetical protein
MELPFEVPAGVELVTDLSTADWIQPRLLPQDRRLGVRVGEIIPTGFDAYARVFHPAREGDAMEPRRWSELAERNERVVHPEMQLEHIVGVLDISGVPGLESPLEGDLPSEQLKALVEVLRTFTATPSVCWFAVWEGYGFFGGGVSLSWSPDEDPAIVRARERAELERARRAAAQLDAVPKLAIHPSPEGGAMRSYFIFRGSIDAASGLEFNGLGQAPNLWWSNDRAWCVATEIDGYSTYVGGSARCVEAILADQRLEALPSSVDLRFDLWSDRVNPRPTGMRERW